ncbi:hypothetical protein CCM_00287 [Cordyceps militaris CM01]|uniref:Uncharacterized protein n=1 Tax=Cordyceps militaris (strain CM01) TaxID=983644 RepID=G3J3A3_CORMM|nr:uncharacterized protein CCM_00287 [Cordyceps militaris CM01]EGX95633.1 hypothetical protein CCM_00287 [Cordyceps militaris CM01]
MPAKQNKDGPGANGSTIARPPRWGRWGRGLGAFLRLFSVTSGKEMSRRCRPRRLGDGQGKEVAGLGSAC